MTYKKLTKDEVPKIRIRGAREHNLRDIQVDIPRQQLVVITGLSGSGKSSLAFDTIYAEGQRRYVESLSAYARQFLNMMQKPDVDSIEGLSPAISIEQKTTSKNPRSTVGTVTEIYDYMRLLWARVGIAYSPATGLPIESQTVSQIVDSIRAFGEKKRLMLMAPIVRGRKGEYKKEIGLLKKKGFQRIQIDGKVYDIEECPSLDKKRKHNISVIVDRIVTGQASVQRITESVETILGLCEEGLVSLYEPDSGAETMFSTLFACPVSGFTISEIEPRLFSFNNPFGACAKCDGLGTEIFIDSELVVPDRQLSLEKGAILPWSNHGKPSRMYMQTLGALARHFKFRVDIPFGNLHKEHQNIILFGTEEIINFSYEDEGRIYKVRRNFEGVISNLERRWRETESHFMREEYAKYQTQRLCSECSGHRLKMEALAVKVDGLHIGEASAMTVKNAGKWFGSLSERLSPRSREIAVRILKELNERLAFLDSVGLGYLTLSRGSGSLSGGESQRIRLASQIGSGLTGVLYVLDEPSIGLHQRDNGQLLHTLKKLRDMGNSVLVVEHDEDAIRNADCIIDMGPKAGTQGGDIVAIGSLQKIMSTKRSLTGAYLSGRKFIGLPSKRRSTRGGKSLVLHGASHNNLKNVRLDLPLESFVCVTGVSGSGKSSLIIETLQRALSRILMHTREQPGAYDRIEGAEHLDKVIVIDQSPIGRTPRSNPATYTGAFTPIRDWFANTEGARARGYAAGRFSFNVKGGRCEACQGDGVIKIEMHFLPDVYIQCDMCKGRRYNRETLEIYFRSRNIADILNMTVAEGVEFFHAVPAIREKLQTMYDVGLGYIGIGQQATTLSGGEAQRIKLSKELSRRATGRTLYILDEPTTGLHFEDISHLLKILQELVGKGNSVLVIEHNLEIIKTADWVIDIGPEGGEAGGEIVTTGTPEQIARRKRGYTAKFLAQTLERTRNHTRTSRIVS